MKNKHPVQVNDLRDKVDHTTPKKVQLFEEVETDPANVNAILYVILIKRREIQMNSDDTKNVEVKVKQMKILKFKV